MGNMGSICMLSVSYIPYMSGHLEGDSAGARGFWSLSQLYLRAKSGYTLDKQDDRDRTHIESVQIPHRKSGARLKPMSFLLCGYTASRCTTVAPLGTV